MKPEEYQKLADQLCKKVAEFIDNLNRLQVYLDRLEREGKL